jgi:hypothetical protein
VAVEDVRIGRRQHADDAEHSLAPFVARTLQFLRLLNLNNVAEGRRRSGPHLIDGCWR